MSAKQTSAEYQIGSNVYGAKVSARRHTDYMNRTMWTITTHATCQRDDDARISGITDEQIEDLHRALREQRLQHGE